MLLGVWTGEYSTHLFVLDIPKALGKLRSLAQSTLRQVAEVPLEREIKLLRAMVESVLPKSLRLEAVDVVVGSLWEGQQPNFKAVVRVRQQYDDPIGTAGWVAELTDRVRAQWGRDHLYVEVIETGAEGEA